MLVPKVDVKEFEKFGFIRCKGIPKNEGCYYLCVARGSNFIFVSPVCFEIQDWDPRDPRIHERPNCRYRDDRTAIEIMYELIKADMLKKRGE